MQTSSHSRSSLMVLRNPPIHLFRKAQDAKRENSGCEKLAAVVSAHQQPRVFIDKCGTRGSALIYNAPSFSIAIVAGSHIPHPHDDRSKCSDRINHCFLLCQSWSKEISRSFWASLDIVRSNPGPRSRPRSVICKSDFSVKIMEAPKTALWRL